MVHIMEYTFSCIIQYNMHIICRFQCMWNVYNETFCVVCILYCMWYMYIVDKSLLGLVIGICTHCRRPIDFGLHPRSISLLQWGHIPCTNPRRDISIMHPGNSDLITVCQEEYQINQVLSKSVSNFIRLCQKVYQLHPFWAGTWEIYVHRLVLMMIPSTRIHTYVSYILCIYVQYLIVQICTYVCISKVLESTTHNWILVSTFVCGIKCYTCMQNTYAHKVYIYSTQKYTAHALPYCWLAVSDAMSRTHIHFWKYWFPWTPQSDWHCS